MHLLSFAGGVGDCEVEDNNWNATVLGVQWNARIKSLKMDLNRNFITQIIHYKAVWR